MTYDKFKRYSEEENRALIKFCKDNNIKNVNMREFFFELNGKSYRVSSFRPSKVSDFETNPLPWLDTAGKCDIIFIKAKRSLVPDIYNALKEGRDLSTLKKKKVKPEEPKEEIKEEVQPEPIQKSTPQISSVQKKQNALNSLLGKRR